jgi:ADP-heptose:LPS heptosyltransferase
METVFDRLPMGARVAVIRLRSLGDCVLTTPALALLKTHRPDLKISVLVDAPFTPAFTGNPDIEDMLPPEPVRADLIINLHGGTRSMMLVARSRGKHKTGFAHHRYSFLYSAKTPTAQQILGVDRKVHTAEHLASAMFWLGVPRTEIPRARLFAEPYTEPRPYAVIHPFAATPEKTWPADRFIAAAEHLRAGGLEPHIIAGPGDDVSPFGAFRVWANQPLEKIKSVISGAQVFLGNDSGPAHIAAAFGVPVVALFGPSDPVIWAPWRTESRVLAHNPITAIATDQVVDALESLKVRA